MACPYFLLSRYDFFVNKGIRTSSDHTSMDGLEAGPARLFHSCQSVGIDAFKVVRFSFPVISEFLTPFTTIVPDVSKRYHIGVENLFASMKKMSLRSSSTMKASAGRSHALFFGGIDYQCVIKCSVETRPKKACVSTLYLKWCLIISELQNAPWLRPDTAFHGEVFLCHSTLESDVMDEFLL